MVELQTKYSDVVWEKHQDFLASDPHYSEDIHYPLLLILTWKSEEPSHKKQRTS